MIKSQSWQRCKDDTFLVPLKAWQGREKQWDVKKALNKLSLCIKTNYSSTSAPCIEVDMDQTHFIKPSLLTSMAVYSKTALETCFCEAFTTFLEVPLGCEDIHVPMPRHWDKSRVQDVVASSPYGQQPCRQSSMPRLHVVSSAKCSVPWPMATSCPFCWHGACLAMPGGMLSHGASPGRWDLRGFRGCILVGSKPCMWACCQYGE